MSDCHCIILHFILAYWASLCYTWVLWLKIHILTHVKPFLIIVGQQCMLHKLGVSPANLLNQPRRQGPDHKGAASARVTLRKVRFELATTQSHSGRRGTTRAGAGAGSDRGRTGVVAGGDQSLTRAGASGAACRSSWSVRLIQYSSRSRVEWRRLCRTDYHN